MTKKSMDNKKACPYCGMVNWLGGWDNDGLWIASAHTGQWPIIELQNYVREWYVTYIDECQNCGAVVSL